MRLPRLRVHTRLALVASAIALVAGVLPATAATPVPWPLASDNVTWHGTIPLDAPGVGGEVVERDGETYFYVTGAYGLSIYDTSDPALPTLVGHLAFPHSQNEDLKVSEDGTRAVLAADGSLPYSPNYVTTGVHVIDTTDVTDPVLVGSTSAIARAEGPGTGRSEHTVACADAACDYVYGSSSGDIYDLTDPANITVVGKWNVLPDGKSLGSHALNRDATGLLISDSNPRLVLDVTGEYIAGASPTTPQIVAMGARSDSDTRLQHNNLRVGADAWEPRQVGDAMQTVTVEDHPRSLEVVRERPVLRPGELFIGTSESNINPTCSNAGGLSTWSMVDFEKGKPLQQLEVFKPLSGTWVDGSPAAQWAGCSAHWFDQRDGMVAAAWYEHGTHFFDVDGATGTIREVGFFQSVQGVSSAAYWINDSFVYVVDGTRGIDILEFDRTAARPSQQELTDSWVRSLGRTEPAAVAERLACRLAAGAR
jgi:hypothetical protein